MDVFLQVTACVLLAVIMVIVLGKQDKEVAIALTVGVCCMVALVSARYMEPLVEFLERLEKIGRLDSDYLEVLLKIVGIGFLSETAVHVCNDAGSGALGKMLQMLSSFVILWLAIPVLNSLLTLFQEILGEL